MTPIFRLSVEFCALTRPGPSIMPSEPVDRQVSNIMDSRSAVRQGLGLGFPESSFFMTWTRCARGSFLHFYLRVAVPGI